jgi:hypothetical protein
LLSTADEIENVTANDNEALVLLSSAAQRKARKSMRASHSEEIFRLATFLTLKLPFEYQIYTLITLLDHSHVLLEQTLGGISVTDDLANATTIVELPFIETLSLDARSNNKMVIHPDLTMQYLSGQTKANSGHNGAALSYLIAQFLSDILENKTFQTGITGYIETMVANQNLQSSDDSKLIDGASRQGFRTAFLQFSDRLLQLHSYCSNIHLLGKSSSLKKGNADDKIVETMEIVVGNKCILMPRTGMGKGVSNCCLDILKSLQKILDIPTFITIFQELLVHSDTVVRQKAFQMLTTRLETLNLTSKISFGMVCRPFILNFSFSIISFIL